MSGPTDPRAFGIENAAPAEQTDILVVDDLPEKLLVFGTVLEELRQNLVFVRSGADALREVLQREFAVILLDVNMPDMDGFETAALIRQHRRSAHTPIIFITAYADEMQTSKGYQLGAVDYILSPVVPEMLRSKVKVFVELHQMQRRVRRQADERVALAAALSAQRLAEDNERRSSFLANAGRQLGASLDLRLGMQRLIELVVPELASRAALLLVDDQGRPERGLKGRAAAGDAAPALVDVEPQQFAPAVREAIDQAIASRRRVVLPAADRWVVSGQFDHEPPIAQPSALAVPLLLGERVLGVLLVAADSSAHGNGVRDWPALEELASRAAIAFENARLYSSLQAEIAERSAAQAELQVANQRKDEFLAMLSHELRNPLAPIRNAVEVMRRVAPPDPKLVWATDVLDRQARHLGGLVDDLLDVARISQGKIALNRERVDLNAVIAHGQEAAQPLFEARRQTLVVERAPAPVWLHGDFSRLSQVVSNLLHNACKYSEEGGRVELKLWAADGCAHIVVRDNGIGIDPALMPHIFELFSQGQRSLDRSQGGLGVGLTLVRRLVELHGGRIVATSGGAGKGSEFEVTIPCINVVSDEPAGDAPPPPAAGASGSRILIVDDNLDAAESIALFLQLEGHEVRSARDVMTALASVPVFAPQVVLLDIGLPVLDGYEVARRMRQMPATRDALIVAVSGYGQPEDKQRSKEAGFDHHFVKPTDPNQLVQLIADWQREGGTAAATAAARGR